MKSDVLKEVIKKIVQQEVKSILKKELRSCLAEMILAEDSKKTKIREDAPIKMEEMLEESIQEEVVPTPPKKFVKYTNNEMLNQILNETKGGIPREGQYVGLSEGFSNIGGDASIINEAMAPVKAPESATPEVKGVYQAITRDYSKLMKVIDTKRKKV